MRRVILTVSATIAGLVLLLGFKTHSNGKTAVAGPLQPGGGSSVTGTNGTGGAAGSSGSSPANTPGSRTATGDAVDTQFGPVQVKVTVANGKITSAQAIQYPDSRPRDQEINSFAIPQLQQETVAANSANIDMVSGATYTSEGYVQSLQSALDKLG